MNDPYSSEAAYDAWTLAGAPEATTYDAAGNARTVYGGQTVYYGRPANAQQPSTWDSIAHTASTIAGTAASVYSSYAGARARIDAYRSMARGRRRNAPPQQPAPSSWTPSTTGWLLPAAAVVAIVLIARR